MNVVVVESPAKAKTIGKYLGRDYTVLPSYGHVRDLPAKDGSVRPDDDFSMSWEVDGKSDKRLREIASAVKNARHLFLATDPDREGEAISWHVREELARRRALKDVDVKRVTFNAVTKDAVLDAFRHPRDLDDHLIEAYLARRALDYLVGFTLSPVLWRKLPGSRSAGRVQSVALRLVCEREAEIEAFRSREYWTVDVALSTEHQQTFTARLTHLEGRKLDKFDLPDKDAADRAVGRLEQARVFRVQDVERKQVQRHPAPPFTTSTLQQEASRKLGFSATHTMRVAQKLYEGVDVGGETIGLITYMRTDGVQVAQEAIGQCRRLIDGTFGADFVPDRPRVYRTPAKNAQEAHEAIRPTDLFRRPEQTARHLDKDQQRLYELIWKRMVASQMASAVLDQVSVDVAVPDAAATLRATGSTVQFEGFLRLYQAGSDDARDDAEGGDRRLPPLDKGQALVRDKVAAEQHFTQPPPRYTEASLVKRMEELGIGRPSTYASILQVLQDRDYVRLERRRFVPEDRGRLVTAFLQGFFERYVQYDFTAQLEDQLDEVSGGRIDWRALLARFWKEFKAAVDSTSELRISDVINALDTALGPHFFPPSLEHPDAEPRLCPACGKGRLGLRLGKTGGFIGCSQYPECRYTRPLALENGANGDDEAFPRELGEDPQTGLPVSVRKGPFGYYVQLGGGEQERPKRVSLPKDREPGSIDLDVALRLLALPRELGTHEGETILAGIGRFGPYVKKGSTFRSIPRDEDVLEIGLNRAVALLADTPKRTPGRGIGPHPRDGQPVSLHSGRYGPYVKHGRLIASLPKGRDPEHFGLDEAVALLEAQAAKKGKSGKRASPAAGDAAAGRPAAMKRSSAPKRKSTGRARPKPAGSKAGG
jgi:DNA topoisomerase-1